MTNKVVILDRDGVINHDSDEYIKSPDEWLPIPGAADAIARLKQSGFRVAIASNQSGIGRGLFTLQTLNTIHNKMNNHLKQHGATIDQLEFCPDHPNDAGPYRKPAPGMVNKILANFGADPRETWFVGDSLSDIRCALAAGCKPALVRTGKGLRTLKDPAFKDYFVPIFNDLSDFVDYLISDI